MGERARVDQDRRRPSPGVVDRVDQLALVVGLQVLDREPVCCRGFRGRGDMVGQRRRSVHLRLALTEQVEVGTGQDEDERRGHRISSITSATVACATPDTTSTPPGPSSTKVYPSTAFLSWAINSSSSAVSALGGNRDGKS